MNIAQHKGQPRDQPAGPATVLHPEQLSGSHHHHCQLVMYRTRSLRGLGLQWESLVPQPEQIAIVLKALTVRHAQDLYFLTGGRIPHWTSGRPSRYMKPKSISNGEDEGSSKSVCCTICTLQTSSKEAFKIVPARKKRAARASVGSGWRGKDWQGFLDGPTVLTGHDGVCSQDSTRA